MPLYPSDTEQPAPALSPPFIRADDAARYAHERIGQRREREYGGFILQREDGLFVATEPVAGNRHEFDFSEVFRDARDYPDGHAAWAVYHSHPLNVPSLWTGRAHDQYVSFFSCGDMYAVIKDGHKGLSSISYLSGPSGSLICYTASDSVREAELLSRVAPSADAPGDWLSSVILSGLRDGSLSMQAFIREVAAAGELHVLIDAGLWGNLPQAKAAHSPVFTHLHDAALYAQRRIKAGGFSNAHGLLMHDPLASLYACTEPDSHATLTLPAGYAAVAQYQATPATTSNGLELVRDFFDLETLMNHWRQADAGALYTCTGEGALLEYVSRDRAAERAMLLEWVSPASVRATRSAQAIIRQVAALGGLSVIAASALWRNQGRISAHWQPFAALAPVSNESGPQACDFMPASRRPGFGPPFSFADDAARYLQRQSAAHPGTPLLGFILKHLDEDSFLAAEPWVGVDIVDTQRLVLFSYAKAREQGMDCLRPRLPSRYRLHALFLDHRLDPLGLDFFQPRDLCLALQNTREGFAIHSLYQPAADGSLYRYAPSDSPEEKQLCRRQPNAAWFERTTALEADLRAGHLSRAAYVREIREAGELQFL